MVQTGAAITFLAPVGQRGLTFVVADWSACAPGRVGKAAWQSASGTEPAEAGAVPAALRRRLSPVGRMAMQAVHATGGIREARYLFSSRPGQVGPTPTL